MTNNHPKMKGSGTTEIPYILLNNFAENGQR
jgi:hypothetical protein